MDLGAVLPSYKRNGYTFKGEKLSPRNIFLPFHWGFSKMKKFAPFGSRFFLLRIALLSEGLLLLPDSKCYLPLKQAVVSIHKVGGKSVTGVICNWCCEDDICTEITQMRGKEHLTEGQLSVIQRIVSLVFVPDYYIADIASLDRSAEKKNNKDIYMFVSPLNWKFRITRNHFLYAHFDLRNIANDLHSKYHLSLLENFRNIIVVYCNKASVPLNI